VDGVAKSQTDLNTHTGEANEYTDVNHGIFGPTPSGTFKK
jgi:hypothetical protein